MLQKQGDWVVVPGVRPRNVSLLAKTHVERRHGPGTVVISTTVGDDTFVAVAYIPTKVVEPPPQPEQPRAPLRMTDERRRQMDREAEDNERRERIKERYYEALEERKELEVDIRAMYDLSPEDEITGDALAQLDREAPLPEAPAEEDDQ